jgi:hypothetical protein
VRERSTFSLGKALTRSPVFGIFTSPAAATAGKIRIEVRTFKRRNRDGEEKGEGQEA